MVSQEFIDGDKNVHILKENSKTRFRPGVYVLVKNLEDKYLMVLNNNSGAWEIPGGGLEIGEDLSEGGIREVKEETGYNIKVNNEMPNIIQKDLEYLHSKDLYQHDLHFFYLGELLSEKKGKQDFAEGEQILEVKFFSVEELKNLDVAWWQEDALNKLIENISK